MAGVQVIEIPEGTPRGQQVATLPLDGTVAAVEFRPQTLTSDAEVLAVASPLDAGSGGGIIGALPFSSRIVTADTVGNPGELLEVDASAGEVVVTPPPHPAAGTYLTVLKLDDSPNYVVWDGPVEEDGEGAAVVSAGAAATFVYDGGRWVVESVNTSFNVGGGSGSGISTEGAQDAAAALFTGGSHTGISFVYDDIGNRINATVSGQSFSTRSVSTDTTALAGELLKVDASGGARTVTPPSSPAAGARVVVVKTDASSNAVTWSGTVDGDVQGAQVAGPWVAVAFVFDGSQWLVESTNAASVSSGGGSAPVAAVARLTSGDLALANTDWTAVSTSLDLVLAAGAGDWVEVSLNARVGAEAANALWFDAYTMVGSTPTNWLSTGTTVAGAHWGQASWEMPANYRGSIAGSVLYQLQAGDISGGQVRVRLLYATGGATPTRSVSASTDPSGFPLIFSGKIVH